MIYIERENKKIKIWLKPDNTQEDDFCFEHVTMFLYGFIATVNNIQGTKIHDINFRISSDGLNYELFCDYDKVEKEIAGAYQSLIYNIDIFMKTFANNVQYTSKKKTIKHTNKKTLIKSVFSQMPCPDYWDDFNKKLIYLRNEENNYG